MNIKGVALVTGGSRGLGEEISLALGRAGYVVAVNYREDADGAAKVVGDLGEGSASLRTDVADSSQVEALSNEIKDRWGRLDVLINNAGITRDSLLVKLAEKDWDEVMGTNLKGCFNTIRFLAPLMADSGGGHIINISSRSGIQGNPGQVAYSASKAALIGLTMSLAVELGRDNIKVNAVLPGYMPTDMGTVQPGAMERAKTESLLGRFSDPAEVASFVVWLTGTKGITGKMFDLDSRMNSRF